MSNGNVLPLNFAAAEPAVACENCSRASARATRFCPYCTSARLPEEKEAPERDTLDGTTGNVIHAQFGANTATVVEQAATPMPSVAAQPAAAESVAQPVPGPAADPQTATPGSDPLVQSKKTPSSGMRTILPWMIAGGVILALLTVLMNPAQRRADTPAAAVAGDVTVFAVRDDTTVRSAPTTLNSQKLGTLERGAPIRGSWLDRNAAGYRWFKISAGPYSGDYIWERNLSSAAPVQLAAVIGAEKYTLAPTNAYTGPDVNAPIADTIAARHSVFVVGSVDGGWYEIRLKRGGIAYVRSDSMPAQ